MATVKQTILAIGVTGAGKSTLLDILGPHGGTFCHAKSASGCTVTSKELELPTVLGLHDFEAKVVDNPGQFDSDEKKEEKNHELLAASLQEDETQSFMYVVSPIGGRFTSEVIESYYRVRRAFGVQPHSILLVINQDPSYTMTLEKRDQYRREMTEVLAEYKIEAAQCVYIPMLNLAYDPSTKTYTSPDVKEAQNTLWMALSTLRSEQHRRRRERDTAQRLLQEEEESRVSKAREEKKQEEARMNQLKLEADLARECKERGEAQERERAIQAQLQRKTKEEAEKRATQQAREAAALKEAWWNQKRIVHCTHGNCREYKEFTNKECEFHGLLRNWRCRDHQRGGDFGSFTC